MNSERTWEAWKDKHRQVEVRDEFADTVMNRICQCERRRQRSYQNIGL